MSLKLKNKPIKSQKKANGSDPICCVFVVLWCQKLKLKVIGMSFANYIP